VGALLSKSRETFVRLAEARTKRILKSVRLLGNLSNRSNYSYSQSDVRQIFGAIEAELKSSKNRFKDKVKSDNHPEFKLD